MSKAHADNAAKPEAKAHPEAGKSEKTPAHGNKKPEGAGGGHAHAAPSHQAPAGGKSKGHTPMPDGCHSWGCKAMAKRMNFCNEHFEHFKFGLLKKSGEPVSDYEKKIEHFKAFKAKSAHKAA